MDRVRTGIDGLDQLLCGGLLRGDAFLVAGAPGTGKTSLGMQYLYEGTSRFREPGLFVTFEEFPERIYRDAKSLGWDFHELEEAGKLKVLFTSPEVFQQDIIRDQGIARELIAEIGATRVVVDSISNLAGSGESAPRLRESVYGLVNALKAESLTAVLTRELHEDEEIGTGPEEFVADGLILLTSSYVAGHRMRFLEVRKSRGSRHIQIPSLYFIGQGGLRIVPPFQEAFYRYEEAVSTGVQQLDELLGGGIPYGSFYLFEVDVDIHKDIFDAAFAKDALETGDRYVRIGAQSDERSRWRALMGSAGLEKRLAAGLASGQVVFLGSQREEVNEKGHLAKSIAAQLSTLCPPQPDARVRFQVNLSRLSTFLSPEEADATFVNLNSRCRATRSVVLASVSPRSLPAEQLERIRAAADGIVRVWSEGSYSFLQVVKTVNSARTPVYAITQVPRPPFVEIIDE